MERILLLLLAGLLGYLVYLIFAPFLVPLAWGVVLTLMLFPLHRRIRARITRPNLAALVSTLLLTAIIVAPTLTVAGVFTAQALQIAQEAQQDWQAGELPFGRYLQVVPFERILDWLGQYGVTEDEVHEQVSNGMHWLAGFLARQAGRIARNVIVFIFDLFFTLFVAFYLFRDGGHVVELMRQALPIEDAYREGIFYIAHSVLQASVFSSLIVAAAQGILGGLIFWLLGLKAAVLWGVIMAFFALLPIVGPWIIWLPAALFLLGTGHYLRAGLLLVLGTLIISGVDNVLRPILISGRSQMNGLLVFIGILGGIAAFGMVGLVLGPILMALADAVLQTYVSVQTEARLLQESQ